MLEPKSVTQILRVLELLRQNTRLGFDTRTACSRAIQQVARENNVHYQTIGDGCRRRLNLVDVSEFHRLADTWLNGDAAPIVGVLKRHSSKTAAAQIDTFFTQAPQATKTSGEAPLASAVGELLAKSKDLRITLSEADARMLRVLAQLEDRQPEVLGAELLGLSVKDRLRAALS